MAKPKLTMKQAKFVRGIAEGKTQVQSALDSYDTESYEVANAIAVENLQKPSIQEAVELARVKLNLTPERALKPIDDALNHEDLEMRLKGSDRALKLMNIGNKSDGGTINNFGQMVVQAKDKYGIK